MSANGDHLIYPHLFGDTLAKEALKDIYGRPLPTPAWHDTPPENGWYFYADQRKDWDIAKPVPVHRIEDCDGVRLEALGSGLYGQVWSDVKLWPGVWFGPFRLAKPEWA